MKIAETIYISFKQCHFDLFLPCPIYRATTVMMVETDSIANITVSLMERTSCDTGGNVCQDLLN